MVFLPFSLWLFDSSTFTKCDLYTPWNLKRLVATHTLGKKCRWNKGHPHHPSSAFWNKRNNMIGMRYLQQNPHEKNTWEELCRETFPWTSFGIGDILGILGLFQNKRYFWINKSTWTSQQNITNFLLELEVFQIHTQYCLWVAVRFCDASPQVSWRLTIKRIVIPKWTLGVVKVQLGQTLPSP